MVVALTLPNPRAQAQLQQNCVTDIAEVWEHFGLILNVSNMENC